MIYKTLPKTDIKVSLACLGTMSFGAHVSEITAWDIMDKSLDHGINFFDTAELYAVPTEAKTYGLTESIIGRWLKARNNREKIILATKVVGPGRNLHWIREGKSTFDEKNITQALEHSLTRLQTDYIDLYQLHWPERNIQKFGQRYIDHNHNINTQIATENIQKTLQILQKLQKEGKIRHIGLSNETPWGINTFIRLAKEQNLPKIVSLQNNYSLLTRTFDTGTSEICQHEEIGMLAYSPLGYGVLGGRYLDGNMPTGGRFTKYPKFVPRYRSQNVEKAIKRYKTLAEQHNISLSQLALAFVYQNPFVTSNIIGPSNVNQLEDCIKALDVQITNQIRTEIDQIDAILPNPCP